MRSIQVLHDYWKNPTKENFPEAYLSETRNGRSRFLVELCKNIGLNSDARILEMGCNAGRNLKHLWDAGYHSLSAIEINSNAVKLLQKTYPDIEASLYIGSFEQLIDSAEEFDLIFTIAVLMHIHPDSEWIFEKMVKKTKIYYYL